MVCERMCPITPLLAVPVHSIVRTGPVRASMAVSFLALKVHPLEPAAFVDEIKGFLAG